ncbi:MAG: hypothetical protein Q7R94_03225 [bacterium]|nr:hypothetical protein [bacterium]
MIQKKKIWVRFAAHGPNAKAGRKHKWRCCLTDDFSPSAEILLTDLVVSGNANGRNVTLDANPSGGTCMGGVVAWINFFGDVLIKDDVLHITLQDPSNGE